MRDGAFGLFFAAVALLLCFGFCHYVHCAVCKKLAVPAVFTLDTLKRVLSDNSLVDVM